MTRRVPTYVDRMKWLIPVPLNNTRAAQVSRFALAATILRPPRGLTVRTGVELEGVAASLPPDHLSQEDFVFV